MYDQLLWETTDRGGITDTLNAALASPTVNKASLKPALRDQSLDGHIMVCGFLQQQIVHHIAYGHKAVIWSHVRKWTMAFKRCGDTLACGGMNPDALNASRNDKLDFR